MPVVRSFQQHSSESSRPRCRRPMGDSGLCNQSNVQPRVSELPEAPGTRQGGHGGRATSARSIATSTFLRLLFYIWRRASVLFSPHHHLRTLVLTSSCRAEPHQDEPGHQTHRGGIRIKNVLKMLLDRCDITTTVFIKPFASSRYSNSPKF